MRCAVYFIFLVQSVLSDSLHRLLLISFDGFRPDYVTKVRTPNLYKLSQNGVVASRMKSLFTTKTFPNHFAIATGLYEESHGIVHNSMFDPLFNETFHDDNLDTKWWDNNFSLPIWVANEIHNDGKSRYSGAMMWPGSAATIHGRKPHHLQKFSKTLNWHERVKIIISWFTDDSKPANFVAAYFDEPDATAHKFGPFSDEVFNAVRKVDAIVGELLSQLRSHGLSNVNVVILSDHGMAETNLERVIQLDEFLDKNLYSLYGTTPIWNILPQNNSEEIVYHTLRNASLSRNFTVYKTEEVPNVYHYSKHRRILKMVIVADEGWEITTNVSAWNTSGQHIWGNHGYNNSLDSMRPLFIAHGPLFKENHTVKETFENIDVYPLMCYILGLLPLSQFQNNASFARVQDMLIPHSEIRFSTSMDKLFSIFALVGFGFAVIVLFGICAVVVATRKPPKEQDILKDATRIALKKRLAADRAESHAGLNDEEDRVLLIGGDEEDV